jgi:hypothetical protein
MWGGRLKYASVSKIQRSYVGSMCSYASIMQSLSKKYEAEYMFEIYSCC